MEYFYRTESYRYVMKGFSIFLNYLLKSKIPRNINLNPRQASIVDACVCERMFT